MKRKKSLPDWSRHLAYTALATTLLAGGFGIASAQEKAPPPADPANTQLPEVNVQGKKNPLEESDRKRKELLDKSTPCLGCDAQKVESDPSLLDKLGQGALDAITPQSSKPADHADDKQREVDRAVEDRVRPANLNP